MKRSKLNKLLLVVGATTVAALALAASRASANTGFGTALYGSGACAGCTVQVFNATTGAYGSTIANDSGGYSFSLNNNDQYDFRINTCTILNVAIISSWRGPQPGSFTNLPTLHGVYSGGCF